MRCVQCGAEIRQDKPYCKYCGTRVRPAIEQTYPYPLKPSGPGSTQRPLSKKTQAVIIALSSLVLVLLIALIFADSDAPQANAIAPAPVLPAASPVAIPDNTPRPTPTAMPTAAPEQREAVQPTPYQQTVSTDVLEQFILDGYNREYSYNELYAFSREQVALIRNGMYALSGKIFSQRVNIEYFGSKSWYRPYSEDSSVIITRFNSNQRNNVELCSEYEKANGW